MAQRKGTELELIVARLEKVLSSSSNVTVESPKYLPDKLGGNKREHDIVITIQESHHEVLIAIECRDRSKKVGSPQVEAFFKKCQDTGINQGIIVSTKGFTKPASTKSEILGIRCLNLEEVLDLKWLLTKGLHSYHSDLVDSKWVIIPEKELPDVDMSNYHLIDEQGTEITTAVLNENIIKHFDYTKHIPDATGDVILQLQFSGEGLRLKDKSSGETFEIKSMVAKGIFKITVSFSPFKTLSYEDQNRNEHLGEAALARIDAGDVKGEMAIIRKPSGETAVTFIADKGSKGLKFGE